MSFGTLAVVAGTVALATVPFASRGRAEYRRGVPCATPAERGCVRDVAAAVVSTRVSRGRIDEYVVDLRLRDRAEPATVELPDPHPVFDHLRPGTSVTARLWNGAVARLGLAGVGDAETADSPLVEPVHRAVYGFFGVAWGVLGAAFGRWYARAGRSWRRVPPGSRVRLPRREEAPLNVVLAAGVASIVAFFQVLSFDVHDVGVRTLTAAGVGGGTFALLRAAEHRTARGR